MGTPKPPLLEATRIPPTALAEGARSSPQTTVTKMVSNFNHSTPMCSNFVLR